MARKATQPSVDNGDSDFVPPTIKDIRELKPLASEFARSDRSWRGLLLTLANRVARVQELLRERIEVAVAKRNEVGNKLALTVLANRGIVFGDKKTVVIGDTAITVYDGERGEFSVLERELLARLLIETGHGQLVRIESRVVYEIDTAAAKALLQSRPELLRDAVKSGAVSYKSNKTITVATSLTRPEQERGVKPSSYVYKIPEN